MQHNPHALSSESHALSFDSTPQKPVHNFDTSSHFAHGNRCLSISGGATYTDSTTLDYTASGTMSYYEYAPTTDLALQNLSMIIGNPDARCYANAPWRAFCWMCAYLAEFNREPWGAIKDAVQTSLELSEPVDLKTLPGLDDLWLRHHLNTEGDAAHFVNSLWLRSETRVTQYRYSEIKEGGYLVEYVQLPLVVDYPEWLCKWHHGQQHPPMPISWTDTILWKNHFGLMDGFQENRKTICNNPCTSKVTAVGKASNHYLYNPATHFGKGTITGMAKPKARALFQVLQGDIHQTRAHRAPDAPANEPHLRQRGSLGEGKHHP